MALAECIRVVHVMSNDERDRLGAAGLRYFHEHFEMDRQARLLIEFLERRISGLERLV